MYLKKILVSAMALSVALLAACGGDEAEGTGPVEDLAESPIGTSSSYWQSSANESSSSEVTGAMDVPADEPAESVEMAESSESVESSGTAEPSESVKSSESAEISSSSSENEVFSSSRGTEDIILPSIVDPEILVKATPCRNDSMDTCEYGTLTDERDGQTYKTVKIGNLWWMAENLNYAYLQPVADMDSGSFCLNDSLENCEKYGRLYPWAIALGICPSGWHLPWYEEYKTLIGGRTYASGSGLKSTEWNGTDVFGFAALPSGARYSNGSSNSGYTGFFGDELSVVAVFWTDTKMVFDNASTAVYYYEGELVVTFTVYSSDSGTLREGNGNDSYAVRCVKDY
ncbi:MAG: fibrobacter succinogenes major paralogous domain-containing protein [Fibrobacter sp.]|nr:fibrobacter succinogenes major paralogous domain-containing protein [Fibrobacter sp.]